MNKNTGKCIIIIIHLKGIISDHVFKNNFHRASMTIARHGFFKCFCLYSSDIFVSKVCDKKAHIYFKQ